MVSCSTAKYSELLSKLFLFLVFFGFVFYFAFPGYYKKYVYVLSLVSIFVCVFGWNSLDKKPVAHILSLFLFVSISDFYNFFLGELVLSDFEKVFRNIVLIFPFLLYVKSLQVKNIYLLVSGSCMFTVTLAFMLMQYFGVYAQDAPHYNNVHPGLWFNKGTFSTAIVLFFALFSGIAMMSSGLLSKVLFVWSLVVVTIIMYLTQARGPLIAYVYIIVFLMFYIAFSLRFSKRKVLVFSLFGIFAIFLMTAYIAGDRVVLAWDQFAMHFAEGSSRTSVSVRIDTWKLAWDVFLKKPFFGAGTQSFYDLREELAVLGGYPSYILNYHTHSDYLLTLERGGILGALGFVWMLLFPFFSLKRYGVEFKKMIPLFLVVGSFMIIGVTSASFRHNLATNVFWLCLFTSYFFIYKHYSFRDLDQ